MPNYIHPNGSVLNGTIQVKYSGRNGGRKKTGQLTYVIYGEDINTNEDSIASTPGIPQIYTEINGMWCVEHDLQETGPAEHPVTKVATRRWELTAIFDSDLDTSQSDINPLLRPVVVSRDSETFTDQLVLDAVTGNPVVTANGEPMNVITQYTMPVFTFTKFAVYPFSDAEILDLTNATNNAPFRGAPIGTALMAKVRTQEVVLNNTRFEQVVYTVKFLISSANPSEQDTWAKITLDHKGTWYKDTSGDFTNTDRDGVARGTVFNLKANGEKINYGDPTETITFNRLRKVAFPAF